MNRTGLTIFTGILAILAMLTVMTASPASAQYWLDQEQNTVDGEPTDPDGILIILNEGCVNLDDYGLTSAQPRDDADAESWWDAIINILLELGLIFGDGD